MIWWRTSSRWGRRRCRGNRRLVRGRRSDSAGPVTRPVNGFPPDRLPNQPPARQQTDYDRRIGNYHQP